MKMPESTTEPSIIAPDDAIKLTEDGGVSKLVVREGNGDIPPLHSRCIGMHDHICIFSFLADLAPQMSDRPLGRHSKITTQKFRFLTKRQLSFYAVHYVGRLAHSGSAFMDTKESGSSGQPVTVVAGRGKKKTPLDQLEIFCLLTLILTFYLYHLITFSLLSLI